MPNSNSTGGHGNGGTWNVVSGTASSNYGNVSISNNTVGVGSIGSGNVSGHYIGGTFDAYGMVTKSQSNSPDLPAMVIGTSDEKGNPVQMTFAPEANISASDSTKLMMLMMAVTVSPEDFNALAYVKKQNLERHFKYS